VWLGFSSVGAGRGTKFNSNGDDLTKIRSELEEFRQILSQGRVRPNEARAEPDVLFHHTNTQEEI